MILAQWRKRRANRLLIDHLHGRIVAAARRPAFFTVLATPVTFEGRFEIMTLHAGLVMRVLSRMPGVGAELAQELADSVFRHFDIALREIGISDIGIPKRAKRLAEAFYGRNKAYGEALDADDVDLLAKALARNVYGGADAGKAGVLAAYVRQCARALQATQLETFAAGEVVFPEIIPPQEAHHE
jgi:cytochrome b pre-mRNA-processing protein 3